jgi:hypothetical protein
LETISREKHIENICFFILTFLKNQIFFKRGLKMVDSSLIQKMIETLEDNDMIKVLKNCPNIYSRFKELTNFLPIMDWDPLNARKLVYQLHLKHNIEFGVCPFYSIEMEDDDQYCSADGEKHLCTCVIPQIHCFIRDEYLPASQNIKR